MKEKIVKFISDHKAEISLLVIMLAVTVFTTIICCIFGASDLTQVVVSASVGILSLIGMESLEDITGMKLGVNKRPAYVGIIIGVLIALL